MIIIKYILTAIIKHIIEPVFCITSCLKFGHFIFSLRDVTIGRMQSFVVFSGLSSQSFLEKLMQHCLGGVHHLAAWST